jgi:tRNA-2-methylthio-N6-dimethylallyladenosine synthase
LAARGYREVWLLGQNVNSYGKGTHPPTDFARLLRRIDAEAGIPWLRFITSHPKDLSDRLIDALAEIEALCPMLHLPIQSGSDAVLERMARGYTAARYFDRVDRLRERVPDLSLTTDVIVGYPGETEADHEATMAAVRRAQYDNIYLFKYSPRPGTPAEHLPDRVSPVVATRRFDEVNRLQKEITRARLTRFVGREMTALVDGPSKRDATRYGGRIPHNLTVNFGADVDYTGRFVRVTITNSRQYSLDADIVLPVGRDAGEEKRG